MDKIFVTIISVLFVFNSLRAQHLVSITALNSFSVAQIQASLANNGIDYSNMTLNPVDGFSVKYNTTDEAGNPVIASGAVYIPSMLNNCPYVPLTVYEHGTEFQEDNVPSTGYYYTQGVFFSTTGYITVLPDYLGLGSNPGYHLYHHAETEATATLDLIRAVREYLDMQTNIVKDNGQLFITGYSHGGHSAMATHKYIQENNLQSEFNVVMSVPMSGAYDLVGAQYNLIFDGDSSYYASPFLPYILTSMQEVYGNLYNNLSDVYDAPYDVNIQNLLANGNSSFYQWYVGIGGSNYYNFMQDSVLNNMLADVNRDIHPIHIALKANNVYRWVPQAPVRMLYCGADSMVSPNNAIVALDTMLSLGANDVQAVNIDNNADHSGCFKPSIVQALNFFEQLAVHCIYLDLSEEEDGKNDYSILPNPASDEIIFKGISLENRYILITSMNGKEVLFVEGNNENKVNIKSLPKGTFIVHVQNEEGKTLYQSRLIKD